MAGQIHAAIQKIITGRGNGNPALEQATRTKLLLKGVDPSKWTPTSPDDAAMLAKIKQTATEFGVAI